MNDEQNSGIGTNTYNVTHPPTLLLFELSDVLNEYGPEKFVLFLLLLPLRCVLRFDVEGLK